MEVDDAGGGLGALLDAGDADGAGFIIEDELGFRILEGDGAGEVFGDGVGVAEDGREADGEFAVAGDEAEAEGFDPLGTDEFVGPAVG